MADAPVAMTAGPAHAGPRRSWRRASLFLLVALLAGIALGEALGWPFLAGPVERAASQALGRAVSLSAIDVPSAVKSTPFRVRFVGGLRLTAPSLRIAAPDWSVAPHLLAARDVTLALRYSDLWQARQGGPLRIRHLQADWLDAWLERTADGRASWQFAAPKPPAGTQPPTVPMPVFDSLQVTAGQLQVHDLPLALTLEARLSLVDGAVPARVAQTAVAVPAANRLHISAHGQFRGFPTTIELSSSGVLPWVADSVQATPVPLTLAATVGRTTLAFQGTALDVMNQSGLSGRFTVQGPSLAAVGDPVGVTLPTTAPFRMQGKLVKRQDTWNVIVDAATIGASRLDGAFTYTTGRPVPLLAGRLGGKRLQLADLGPALGTAPKTAAGAASEVRAKSSTGKSKVLPDRPFDLAALRAMEAQLVVAIDEVTLTTGVLEPVRPLRAHLNLAGGVLTLTEIDARTGQGRLWGELELDGRGSDALWRAGLGWDGLRLEQWIRQTRRAGAPPYVAGRLQGRLDLTGQGRSTAGILASLSGKVRAQLHDGAVSHLAIEAGGLDIAQGLGMLIKGDDALPVLCAVTSLVAEHGVFRPQVMVLDTTDSTVLVDGSVSLAAETLDLHAVVTPKDFSPLTLRTPLHLHGSLAQPVLDLDKGPLGRKAAAAVLLAFINPLAALIPLVDLGNTDEARRAASGCQRLTQHAAARTTANPPVTAKTQPR